MKYKKNILLIILLFMLYIPNVLAASDVTDMNYNCINFSHALYLLGLVVLVAKVAVPLIIIVKASISMLNVVISSKPQDELNKQLKSLMWSLIAAALVFMSPVIIKAVFGIFDNNNAATASSSKACRDCIFDPNGDECTAHKQDALKNQEKFYNKN